MCQCCTLNIYRKAIYVIAWFSSTNIHALGKLSYFRIVLACAPSFLCNIRTLLHSSIFFLFCRFFFHFQANNLISYVSAFTIYFCTVLYCTDCIIWCCLYVVYMLWIFASILALSLFVLFVTLWLLFSAVQTNWLFVLAMEFTEYCNQSNFHHQFLFRSGRFWLFAIILRSLFLHTDIESSKESRRLCWVDFVWCDGNVKVYKHKIEHVRHTNTSHYKSNEVSFFFFIIVKCNSCLHWTLL